MATAAQTPAPRISIRREATTAALAGSAVALLAGVSGGVPPPTVLALAVGPPGLLIGLRLVRLALAIHAATRDFSACRGAGFLGLGVLAAAATAAAPVAIPEAARPVATVAGLAVAAGMFLLGLLLLPGAVPEPSVRLRHGIDGLSIGITLAFTGWLAASSYGVPPYAAPPLILATGLVLVAVLSTITVVVARAASFCRSAVLSGAGAAVVLCGLAGLAIPLAYPAGLTGQPWAPGPAGRWLPVWVAVVVVAGALLAWSGARRVGLTPTPTDPGGTTLAGYPLLTVPVGAALVMTLYHLVVVGGFDRTAVGMGLAAAALLAVREGLAVADVRRYAHGMARREAHWRSLVAAANDVILVLDDGLVVRWQSPAAARLFGLSDQEVLGRPFPSLLHPDDAGGATELLAGIVGRRPDPALPDTDPPALVAARLRDGYGHWRDTESAVSDQRGVPEVRALVLHLRDVRERRHLEQALHRMASVDQLTGLPHRQQLVRALTARRAVAGRGGAVLAIDLHGLGDVNDERGREVGDAVLVEVARRLRAVTGPDDLPVRLAGDQFGVLTHAGPVQAYALGVRLLAELTRPYELPGAVVTLHASVGLAEAGDGDLDELLERADVARRRARQQGVNRLEWYDVSLEQQLARHMDIERELPGAVERGELDLVFQPVVLLADRRPAGVEALLRWRHPGLGTVLPAELLPVAESLGLADEIGRWVLSEGCRHLASWRDTGSDVWLAVNVSPRQLAGSGFADRVGEALARRGLPADKLVIEVATDQLGGQLAAAVASQLAALRALGTRTALDDFGATDHLGGGHGSLTHLRRLPLDILKLDGMLVCEPAGRQLLEVAVNLGRRLGLELVAEGLESRSRLDAALRAGCQLGQGFLLAQPMPAEHLEAYLEGFRTPSL